MALAYDGIWKEAREQDLETDMGGADIHGTNERSKDRM